MSRCPGSSIRNLATISAGSLKVWPKIKRPHPQSTAALVRGKTARPGSGKAPMGLAKSASTRE
jgi:hypothetical protein